MTKEKKLCQEHAKATLNVWNCWSIKSLQKNTEHKLGFKKKKKKEGPEPM